MYEALHQRTMKIEIITVHMKHPVWYQHKKTLSTQSVVIMGLQMGEISTLG
jgi:hypothetical protein